MVCYAPTNCSGDQPKDTFYEAFSFVVIAIPTHDLMFYLRVFNAQVGSSACKWEGVLGGFNSPSTAGPPTDNGLWLRSFCLPHRLSVVASYFAQLACQQATFTHQNAMACSTTIDHILVSQRHCSTIRSTRVYPSYSFHNTLQWVLGDYLRVGLCVAPCVHLKAERRCNTQLLHNPNNVKFFAWR
jgi:hypothetical protein